MAEQEDTSKIKLCSKEQSNRWNTICKLPSKSFCCTVSLLLHLPELPKAYNELHVVYEKQPAP